MVESGRVPGKGRIRASIEKVSRRVPKKGSNQCKYRKMVESSRVPVKCRIRASIDKVSRRVREKGRMTVCTEKWKNPDVYREKVESLRVSKIVPTSTEKKSNHCEYRKMVESGRVPEKGRIPASIEKTVFTSTGI